MRYRKDSNEQIYFCGHDKIVAVQPSDFMGPPGDGYLSPFSQDGRVVALLFGQRTYLLRNAISGRDIVSRKEEP